MSAFIHVPKPSLSPIQHASPQGRKVKQLTPNSTKMPNNSTANPISGHLMRMRSTPAQNAKLPLHLFLRAKNTKVRCGPSKSVIPTRKRMFPMASRARSKKRIRPSRKKKPPPLQKATPISVGGEDGLALCFVGEFSLCICLGGVESRTLRIG